MAIATTSKGRESTSSTVARAKKMLSSSLKKTGGSVKKSDGSGLSQKQIDQLKGASGIDQNLLSNYEKNQRAITPDSFKETPAIDIPKPVAPTAVPDTGIINASLGQTDASGMFTPIATQAGDSESVAAAKDASNTTLGYLQSVLPMLKGEDGANEKALIDARREAGVKQAQEEYNRYQNQINAITSKRDAQMLGLEGQGRGITDTIIGGQQARISREAAIMAMPIQAQLAAAQGNLEQAKELMGQLYQVKSADIQADQTYRTNLANSVMGWANTAQSNILQAKLSDISQGAQTAQANLAYQRQLGLQALEYGQNGLITGISSIDPNSPTFEQDIAAYTSQLRKPVAPTKLDTSFDKFGNLIDMQTGEVIRYADPTSGVNGGIEMPDGSFATPDEIAYAQQYAATGQIPTGLSAAGVDFGRVADLAKDMKKPDGALVNQFTGVTPTNIGDAQKAGIVAMSEIVNDIMPQLESLWEQVKLTNFGGTGIVGGISSKIAPSEAMTRYKQARDEFLSKLLVARSGAAVTEQEYERYSKLVPDAFNSSFYLGSSGATKLEGLSSLMKTNLDNTLSTNQLTLYGYSTVNLDGQDYKVGEIITNEYGQQGLVQPDGSITLVNQ